MSPPVAVVGAQPDAGKWRQQHGEVELLLALRPVQGLVPDPVLVHLLHVGAGDPVDAALGEQRLGEQAARHDVAAALELHAAHAEVAELVLVRDPDDLRLVPHLARPQLELEVHRVFERGSLTGAGAVADADQEALPLAAPHPLHRLVERGGGRDGVLGRAHGQAVVLRAESLGLVEAEPWPGGVDQEVVRNLLRATGHRLGDDIGRPAGGVALGVNLAGPGLLELDAVTLVDGRERERHLARSHQADADPDVGRDPVVGLIRRDHRHGVARAQPLPGEGGRGVPGDSRAENHHPAHRRPPIRVLILEESGTPPPRGQGQTSPASRLPALLVLIGAIRYRG